MGNQQSKLDNKFENIDNIINYLDFINDKYNIDIDNYYYDLLEQAIEYGMTPKQFWEEDIELFYCYRNAYIKRTHYQYHTLGLYNVVALGTVLGNMFKKQGTKNIEYPKDNLLETNIKEIEKIIRLEDLRNGDKTKIITKNITKDNLEEQYRLRLSRCY